jgi:hypothetical protein
MTKPKVQNTPSPASPERTIQEIRRIIESAPAPGPRPDPNREAGPLTPDFFTTKPGFWDEYSGRRR